MGAKSNEAARAGNGVRTAVVIDDGDAGYAMLEPTELTCDGGFLGGHLFFEVAEEFALRVSGPGNESMRLRVRVVEIERGAAPGMWVEFVGLDDEERKRLAGIIGDRSHS